MDQHTTISKITHEMDKLDQFITHQQALQHQLQLALHDYSSTSSIELSLPTAKSIPISPREQPCNDCLLSESQFRGQIPAIRESKNTTISLNEGKSSVNKEEKLPRKEISKIIKINKEELRKLNDRKNLKNTDTSTKRDKKTRRDQPQSVPNHHNNHHNNVHNNYHNHFHKHPSAKNYISNKTLEQTVDKKKLLKHERGFIQNEWVKMTKQSKKLNRVNICKLQENIKKNNLHNPKPFKEITNEKKETPPEGGYYEKEELKLNLLENQPGNLFSPLRLLLAKRNILPEYQRASRQYTSYAFKITPAYLQRLAPQCRESSRQAIFKMRIISEIIVFFQQFFQCPLDTKLSKSRVQSILGRPEQLLRCMNELPSRLLSCNTICENSDEDFISHLDTINECLEQELELFVLKKTPLYGYAHSLQEYLNFLSHMRLLENKPRESEKMHYQTINGYYSSRSKRENVEKKKCKLKKGKEQKYGYRCDSDRKVTVADEDIPSLQGKHKFSKGKV